jgi:zinc protease
LAFATRNWHARSGPSRALAALGWLLALSPSEASGAPGEDRSLSSSARLSAPGKPEAPSTAREADIVRYRLPNGLSIVLDVDRSESGVVTCLTYPLGSRHEAEAGAAWLLQYLLSAPLPDTERASAMSRLRAAGASLRVNVTPDYTQYVTTAPAGLLPLALELEALRLERPRLSALAFAELRGRAADALSSEPPSIEGFAEERLRELVFQGYWPYAHGPTATAGALASVGLPGLLGLYDSRMRLTGAVLSVVGNFSEADGRRLVRLLFSAGARSDRMVEQPLPELPRQTSQRAHTSMDAGLDTPMAFYAWAIPRARTSDHDALQVLAELFAEPNDGGLRSRLIGAGHALDLAAWTLPQSGPGAFVLRLGIQPSSSVDQARSMLERELDRLRTDGPSEALLGRAKARLAARHQEELRAAPLRASLLGRDELSNGDARLALSEPTRYGLVTRTEVRLAAARYLTEDARSSVELYPPAWPEAGQEKSGPTEHVVKAGENLLQIARRHGTSVDALEERNRIGSAHVIFPGQKLVVPQEPSAAAPGSRTYRVKRGDSLSVIAERLGVSTAALAAANGRRREQRIVVGETLRIPEPAAAEASASSQR